ncbi:A24 family peptidase [Stratiformator vulcanicus]|uniref:Type IV leader peptidase family protein n=1 Tax=Stratiformator vulcanicus TaxID=2527980 RepID=A0A517R2M7_9PLAN|nr:A24 family peptidase [Stratiformator vulcanicus]QDT38140.1 Type IV leader peptidase family protein [Stratiformator vulcanicus]
MPESILQLAVLLTGLAVYSVITLVTDIRYHRIPNKVTVPMFAAGWIYQLAFAGLPGLADGGLGFLAGFGILFILWMIGAAGGGDVKLMGGLSVWLGWQPTLIVLAISVPLVVFFGLARLAFNWMQKLFSGASDDESPTAPKRASTRVMPFAVPVALAVWTFVGWSTYLQLATG